MRLGKVRHESKYLAIEYFHTEKNWSIGWMCKHLEVARAAYYKWLHRETPEDEMENIKLAELIKEYDERFSHILGYRRMTSWINHFNQTKYSKNRVHRIMKKLGIHSVIRKKKKKYRNANADETTQNILQRDFYATAPNQKWATDVTEFKVPGKKKKLYLSAIIDLYDRYPVSYAVSARNDNKLVFKTFDKAIALNPCAKPIFHSDRGFQYTSKMFKKKLVKQEMRQSMSRVGHCIDNGPTEGFWGIIKAEMYQMYEITDESSLRFAIKDYIRFYSEERPQDRYCCKTPLEVRQEALKSDIPVEYPIPENKRIKSSFESYIYKAARNHALMFLRKAKRHIILTEEEMNFCIENTFEDEVCIAERNKRIYDCMEYLPSAQKEALYLVYIEGMSYKEAAAVLRKSAKQIDKLLQLGKKKLRPLLETEGIKSAFND